MTASARRHRRQALARATLRKLHREADRLYRRIQRALVAEYAAKGVELARARGQTAALRAFVERRKEVRP